MPEPASATIDELPRAEVMCRLTGPAHIESPAGVNPPLARSTEGIHLDGTDLGVPFPWHQRWRLLFGDTDTNPRRGAMFHQQSEGVWGPIPNALAELELPTTGDCPTGVQWFVRDGAVAAVLPREAGEASVIFAGAVTINETVYAQAMSIGEWGAVCDAAGVQYNYCVRYGFMARSRDGGEHFERLEGPRWSMPSRVYPSGQNYTDSGFAQCALARGRAPDGGEVVWLFGAQAGRRGALHLAYVPVEGIEQPGAYRYLVGLDDGAPRWGVDPSEAVDIVPSPVGESSVAWVPSRALWVLLRFDVRLRALVVSTARHPWGPWSQSMEILDCRRAPWMGCYGGFTYGGEDSARFMSPDGRWLYFTVSHWATYETYLARFPIAALPGG